MTVRKVWLGSTGPFLFDDAVLYIDEDGVISPDNQQAIATDGQIVIQSPPTSPVHAVRKQDLDNAVGDISSLEARVDLLETTTSNLGTISTQDADAVAITGGNGTFNQLTSRGGVDVLDSAGAFQVAFAGHKSAGANRWNLFCDGTAVNYLQGKLALGTTTPHFGSQLTINWRHADTNGIAFQVVDSDTGLYVPIAFLNLGGGVVGSISNTATATAYNTSSDVRLKHSIMPLAGVLELVRRLRPIKHLWNADNSRGYGFLAHELQLEIPDAVMGEPNAVNNDGSINPQQVDHSKLVPWLTAALKETLDVLDTLTARITSLEQQLTI